MERNFGPEGGLTKGQVVLYGFLTVGGIVLFTLLFVTSQPDVSDIRQEATSTQLVVVPQEPIASGSPQAPQTAATTEFTYEVVATEALRQKGLSGRANIPQDYGMLFIFATKDRYGFWMKDMREPIDIIWLSDTGNGVGTIVGIEQSVSPSTYPATFTAPEPVRFVLETRAGEARRQGWAIGTRLTLPSDIPVPQ